MRLADAPNTECVLLGIDPGLRITGYGVVRAGPRSIAHLDHGAIRTTTGEHAHRLLQIHAGIKEVLDRWDVEEVAIEKQFIALNASSAFAIGEARAASILACALAGLAVTEYTPAEVKQAVTSYGRSGKSQVQEMVRMHFGWSEPPQPADAADALAIALCHAARRSLPRIDTQPARARRPASATPRAGVRRLPSHP